jgi:hypothetical protein
MLNLVDPAKQSHPHWDIKLETAGQTISHDWIVSKREPTFNREVMIQRNPEGRALFEALKRQFYFEHRCGNESFAMQLSTLQRYSDLLQQAKSNSNRVLREIISIINRAYCSQMQSKKDALYLWVGHRYHEQPSRAWISDTYCPSNLLDLQLPRLPYRISDHLPYEADHFLLKYRSQSSSNPITLKIDFDLFRTLENINSGLPRNLLPERAINRLDDFIHALLAKIPPVDTEFYTYHAERNETLKVQHDGKKFEEIKKI